MTHARGHEIEGHFDQCDECRELAFALATHGTDGSARAPGGETMLGTGSRLGRFVIEERIAEGAMGMIFRAHDPLLRRDVALKLLRVVEAAGDAHPRMLREAQVLARLDHPNVVTVYETGLHEGEVFIAMELIEGVSLARWVEGQHRSWRQIAALLAQAGRGLAAAHAGGLVHRDFKPANIMIENDQHAKVVDFGLARAVAEALPRGGAKLDITTRLTATGTLVGTPAYCAPEQLAGYEVDTASDVFSFCVTCCEVLFGRRPFEAGTASALLARMGDPRGPDLPRAGRVPARLRALLRRGLAFDPKQRPALDELLVALATIVARKRLAVAAAAAAVAIVGVPLAIVAASSVRGDEPCTTSRAELAAVWNDARRGQVKAALDATQLPFANETWRHVERVLDRYAERWVATHREACEATAVRRTQSAELLDRRMACLASRRADLDAAIGTLAQLDRTTAREATRVVDSLAAVATCDDTPRLLALAPEPTGAAATTELAQLRQLIARASTLVSAGQYQNGLDVARTTVTLAERLGYKPLLAQALFARGSAEQLLQQHEAARASYEGAAWAAAAAGDVRQEAEALAKLALLLRDQSPDGRIALVHASHALALLERMKRDPLLEAKLRFAKARAIYTIDHAAGEREHAQGLALLAEAEKLDAEVTRRLRIDYEILAVEAKDAPSESLPRLAALLADVEKWYGAEHPNNATILWEMAEQAAVIDRADEARGYAARVAHLLAGYPGHDVLIRRLEADVEPDPVKQRRMLEALIRDAEQHFGPRSPQLGMTLMELAENLLEAGEPLAARPYIDRVIELWHGAYGTRFQMLVSAYVRRSQILYALGELDGALEAAETSVELAERNSVSQNLTLFARLILAELYFRAGRYADVLPAIEYIRDNAGIISVPLGEGDLLELDFVEAACLFKLGRGDAHLRRARQIHARYRSLPDADGPSLRDQAGWLATHDRGQR